MALEIQDTFNTLVEKEDLEGTYAFLAGLSHKERRKLVPFIKKLDKSKSKYVQKGLSWSSVGSPTQFLQLHVGFFVCMTQKELEKVRWLRLEEKHIRRIFAFYKPDWFGDFVNFLSEQNNWVPFRMEYEWMMELARAGILSPESPLICLLLPNYLFQNKGTYPHNYIHLSSERLGHFPETLETHIWYLFEEASTISWFDRKKSRKNPESLGLFPQLVQEKRIDRARCITACMSGIGRDTNREQLSWLFEVLSELDPNKGELLQNQVSLIGWFDSANSRPKSEAIKKVKEICTEAQFSYSNFVGYVPMILASETKSLVNRCLMVLEKLAKKHLQQTEEICLLAVDALIHEDATIQKRVAKLLRKYGDTQQEELCMSLSSYEDLLLAEPKQLLSGFLKAVEAEPSDHTLSTFSAEERDLLASSNKIAYPEQIDDLVFFLSQAFDHNHSEHWEILPAALINSQEALLQEDSFRILQPALQRAYKLLMGDWRSQIGRLDHMLALFFVSYCEKLIKDYPEKSQDLKKVSDKVHKKEEADRARFPQWFHSRIYPFEEWTKQEKQRVYRPFHHKLCLAQKLLGKRSSLPLLSTPTHAPHWIDPEVLVERINCWQAAGEEIDPIDFQLAISRCYCGNPDQIRKELQPALAGEAARVISYLLDFDSDPQGPFDTPALWWTTVMSKKPLSIPKSFHSFPRASEYIRHYIEPKSWTIADFPYSYQRYNFEKRKYVRIKERRKELRVSEKKGSNLIHWFSKSFQDLRKPNEYVVYDAIQFKRPDFETFLHNDIKRILSLCPNNPEHLWALLISQCLNKPTFESQEPKRMLIKALEALLESHVSMGDMGHLLISGSMVCGDQTARTLAAEIWIEGVNRGTLCSAELGSNIGKHFEAEFVPLKRFTDLLQAHMFRVSSAHDQALQELLEHILKEMNKASVRGVKKLLELYWEVVQRNGGKVPKELSSKFSNWSESKSLKKLLKKFDV